MATADTDRPTDSTHQQTLAGEIADEPDPTDVPKNPTQQFLHYVDPATDLDRVAAWYRRLKAEGVIR